ncbi:MAG: hypothetical protein ABGZ23_08635 [Fuerstiella sp.]|nr:hypothetical protein [Fuerstiella sp.]
MNLLSKIWRDEAGVLLSAEAAIVGTVTVIGVTSGLSVVATSVNEELKDVGFAIRSLDQSYHIPAQKGCAGAMTAGSVFKQAPVNKSLAELCEVARKAERAAKEQARKVDPQRARKTPQSERMKRQIQQQKKARESAPSRQKPRKI